jgi:hypothetical protein
MKTYCGSGGIGPRILNLGTRWKWVVSFTPRPLYPQRKSPWYLLDRRLGGSQSRCGRGGEEKNSQPPPGIEPQNPDRPAHSPTLYRLNYHGSVLVWYGCESWSLVLKEEHRLRAIENNVLRRIFGYKKGRVTGVPVWWPGNKNSPTVTHACRKRRLKWVATLPLGDINTEAWSSGMGVGRGANNPTL